MVPQQYCLRWKHHHSNVQNMFAQLLEKERFCDVTLYCSPNFATQIPNKDTVEPHNIRGVSLRAHRVVLAACSELLGTLLGAHEAQGEPVLVIDGAEPDHLKALLDYMYTGEMNVHHSQLASLLKTAEELRIKGLTDIRWNNKDEPPDCTTGAVATTTVPKQTDTQKPEAKPKPTKPAPLAKHSPQAKHSTPAKLSPPMKQPLDPVNDFHIISEPRSLLKKELEDEEGPTRLNINGGPPPLIKLPTKEKINITPKRENSDSEHSPSPKRQRLPSGTENTDDECLGVTKSERDDWRHGNLDITAERVVGWGLEGTESSREISDDEWADAPADIGSFLHTRLQVDGDNSGDEESNDSCGPHHSPSGPQSTAVSIPIAPAEPPLKHDLLSQLTSKPTMGPKSGPTDPRFTDVVKLTDYLQHGRRPQFWEENYVKRVMEAVRLKELEMKQAAEILGVSYGTLYGRYRDVYGCINRPYRAVRDFWQVKGPSEVLERLQRGEISLDAAASALGVSVANLAAHVADFGPTNEFDPIPIEVDASLRNRSYSTGSSGKSAQAPQYRKIAPAVPDAKGQDTLIDKPKPNMETRSQRRGSETRSSVETTPNTNPPPKYRKIAPALPPEAMGQDTLIDKPKPNMETRSQRRGSETRSSVETTPNTNPPPKYRKIAPALPPEAMPTKKVVVGSTNDEESIPVNIISTQDAKSAPTTPPGGPATRSSGKWPSIRVANIDSLRSESAPSTSPSQLMRTRPDLTIVAAKKQDIDLEEDT